MSINKMEKQVYWVCQTIFCKSVGLSKVSKTIVLLLNLNKHLSNADYMSDIVLVRYKYSYLSDIYTDNY